MTLPDDFEEQVRAAATKYADAPEQVEHLVESTLARLTWRRRHGFKTCSKCHEDKKPEEFGKNAARSDGLDYYCRECRRHVNASGLSP